VNLILLLGLLIEYARMKKSQMFAYEIERVVLFLVVAIQGSLVIKDLVLVD
jgi:hypothetical protein